MFHNEATIDISRLQLDLSVKQGHGEPSTSNFHVRQPRHQG